MTGIGGIAIAIVMLGTLAAIVFFVLWSLYRQLPRFNFHLSIAVILMLVAGGLLLANMTENGPPEVYITIRGTDQKNYEARIVQYGWPLNAVTQLKNPAGVRVGFDRIHPMVMFDVAFAVGILCLIGYASEKWIRMRASPKSGVTTAKTQT